MRDLKEFGSAKHPLHPSGLHALIRCPWEVGLSFLWGDSDEHGPAGDTGSAMHVAVSSLHKGKEVAESLKDMHERLSEYPLADLQDAATLFLQYAQDPRNRSAEVVLSERKVAFSVAAAPEDPTGEPIVVNGTVDQVRREGGLLRMWDLKTSKKDPMDILHGTTHQGAAYCIGATMLLGEPVHPGGVIVPRRYKQNNIEESPVFYHFAWKMEDIEHILRGVRHIVARVRSGDLWHRPGDHCRWCSAKSPDLCLPKLIDLRKEMFPLEVAK